MLVVVVVVVAVVVVGVVAVVFLSLVNQLPRLPYLFPSSRPDWLPSTRASLVLRPPRTASKSVGRLGALENAMFGKNKWTMEWTTKRLI